MGYITVLLQVNNEGVKMVSQVKKNWIIILIVAPVIIFLLRFTSIGGIFFGNSLLGHLAWFIIIAVGFLVFMYLYFTKWRR